MKGNTYNSATHGPIRLSWEARKLMQTLRESIAESIRKGCYTTATAHARGELAKYMSLLEMRDEPWRKEAADRPMTATEIMHRHREPWPSSMVGEKGGMDQPHLSGKKADMIILDDPQSENAMKKAKATLKKKAAKFQAVGVRFLYGHNIATIYTYKAKRSAKLTLGQEVVIRNHNGTQVAVVVDLPAEFPVNYTVDTCVELTHKVATL